MDTASILHAMRDPAGVPAPPQLFQALAVFTWILHISFVLLTLGAATLSIVAFYRSGAGPHWRRLSWIMTQVAKIGVSLLIVLGVAPLLFTQVIYDPQWYASNVLSARWVIGFIFTLIIGYCLWFWFYARNHDEPPRYVGLFAIAALGLFLLDGLIMHVLSYQALLPDQWMQWYAPGGHVDTSGSQLHAIEWPRFLAIIALSAPAVGLFMLAYADYFAPRADIAAGYLDFVRSLGVRIARIGLPISAALLALWTLTMPAGLGLAHHPLPWLLAALMLGIAALLRGEPARQRGRGVSLMAGGVLMLGLLAIWRELIRMAYLAPFGYHIADYTVHPDWPSLVLFSATLLGVGGLVGGFYLSMLYRAGRVQGVYQAEPGIARMGNGALAVLGAWITVFFVYGIVIFLHNSL